MYCNVVQLEEEPTFSEGSIWYSSKSKCKQETGKISQKQFPSAELLPCVLLGPEDAGDLLSQIRIDQRSKQDAR
jgi:hypothetical protein